MKEEEGGQDNEEVEEEEELPEDTEEGCFVESYSLKAKQNHLKEISNSSTHSLAGDSSS